MRISIVPEDRVVTIDGVSKTDIDMSSVAVGVHAVQWYGDYGEVEIIDTATGRMLRNERIDSLDAYQTVLDSWYATPVLLSSGSVTEIPVTVVDPVPTV